MDQGVPEEMKLAELGERSGVPPRTIRFYIARGVLQGPLRAGRGAAYGRAHLDAVQRIRELQGQGFTLADIRRALAGEEEQRREALPEPTRWWAFRVGDDVVAHVSADGAPWRLRRIQRALGRLAADLAAEEGKDESDERDS